MLNLRGHKPTASQNIDGANQSNQSYNHRRGYDDLLFHKSPPKNQEQGSIILVAAFNIHLEISTGLVTKRIILFGTREERLHLSGAGGCGILRAAGAGSVSDQRHAARA